MTYLMWQGNLPVLVDHEQEARVAAVLTAVWDLTPLELPCPGFTHVTIDITYTRGGVGGAVDTQVQTSPYSADRAGVEDWFTEDIFSAGAVAAGNDVASRIQRNVLTYQATAAGAENYVLDPIELGGTMERLRVLCLESGNVGALGDCHIVAIFS